jgi:hypothetical protein
MCLFTNVAFAIPPLGMEDSLYKTHYLRTICLPRARVNMKHYLLNEKKWIKVKNVKILKNMHIQSDCSSGIWAAFEKKNRAMHVVRVFSLKVFQTNSPNVMELGRWVMDV